jgi:ATP:ADP antiporter, AAA family
MPLLPRVLDLRGGEARPAALAFTCFFGLLAANNALRPIRDALGIESGVHTFPWLWTGTFVSTLVLYPALGALASRTSRTRFAAIVFATIAASLLGFRLLLFSDVPEVILARAFYIWVSVFNVLLASVFWGVMADIFTNQQGRRLFGAIAAGGTAGALAGPLLTGLLVHVFGVEGMLLVAAGLIALALACVGGLSRGGRRASGAAADPPGREADPIIGGKVLAGLSSVARSRYLLTICAYILLLTTTATFVYFQQGWIVDAAIQGREDRTAFFAVVDLCAQGLTLLVQLFLTRRLIRRIGVTGLLIAVPVVTGLGFAALAAAPVLVAVAIFQVARRASESGLGRPAREILFTVVDREDKFKAKNVVDVVVYRGGDAAVAWLNLGLAGAGLGVGGMALAALPLCGVWAFAARALGRMEGRRRAARGEEQPT